MSLNPYESFREVGYDPPKQAPQTGRPPWLDWLLCILAASIIFGWVIAACITYTALELTWFDELGPVAVLIVVLAFVGFVAGVVVTQLHPRRR